MRTVACTVFVRRQLPFRIKRVISLGDGGKVEPAGAYHQRLDMTPAQGVEKCGDPFAYLHERSAGAAVVDAELDDGDVGAGIDRRIEAPECVARGAAGKACILDDDVVAFLA